MAVNKIFCILRSEMEILFDLKQQEVVKTILHNQEKELEEKRAAVLDAIRRGTWKIEWEKRHHSTLSRCDLSQCE